MKSLTNLTRLMVGLDFTEMDALVIQFVSDYLKINSHVEKIYFIHVERSIEWPEEVKQIMPLPRDEELKDNMIEMVKKYIPEQGEVEMSYEIVAGQPLLEILHWCNIKQIDLMIVGKKLKKNGNGVVPQMLARKSKTSIIFINEHYGRDISRILVPMDFSEHGQLALCQAIEMASEIEGGTVIAQHIYSLPTGYSKMGKSRAEMEAIMKKYAMRDFDKLISKVDTKQVHVEAVFEVSHDLSVAQNIINQAKKVNADYVIMGSKGQNASAILLLGSVTEKLINDCYDFPLMVIKKQGENIGFWDALMKI
jgi:nucleotide-binding universal stress UspA family protein